jgi:hypothetical protein
MKPLKIMGTAALISAAMLVSSVGFAGEGNQGKGRGNGPMVLVTAQGLVYDSIVVTDYLPMKGEFQKLVPITMGFLMTEFGPGDVGYVGGRWWLDDGNGVMGPEDSFFLCPLLGPGRAYP